MCWADLGGTWRIRSSWCKCACDLKAAAGTATSRRFGRFAHALLLSRIEEAIGFFFRSEDQMLLCKLSLRCLAIGCNDKVGRCRTGRIFWLAGSKSIEVERRTTRDSRSP
jgi:hypothetical protein